MMGADMLKIYIDGEFYDKKDAKISVFDHGLLYGDGVFEGIRMYNGKIFKCREHIDRLFESARAIRIRMPMSKEEVIAAMEETLKVNNLNDAYIRLVVTRGVGDLGLDPKLCEKPSIIIITDKIALYPAEIYERGLELVTAATPRNHQEALSPRIKSLNYLNNIMAKMEGHQADVREVIMLNLDGYVCECSADNIFMVKNGVLATPPPSAGILKGITRDTIMDIARESGTEVREENITRFDLYVADEVFLCGTAAELIAAVKIDGRVVGDGKPGPVFRELLGKFRELV
jgi:branched-chain amino acid aminotransferase